MGVDAQHFKYLDPMHEFYLYEQKKKVHRGLQISFSCCPKHLAITYIRSLLEIEEETTIYNY